MGPQSHLVLAPASRAAPRTSGPNFPSGLLPLRLPLLLRGHQSSSCHSHLWWCQPWLHPLLAQVPIAPHHQRVQVGQAAAEAEPLADKGLGGCWRRGPAGARRMGQDSPLCQLQPRGPQFFKGAQICALDPTFYYKEHFTITEVLFHMLKYT